MPPENLSEAEAAVPPIPTFRHSGMANLLATYAAPQEVSGQTPVPAQSLAAAPRSESTPDAQGTREPTNSPAQTQPAPPATAPPQIAAAPGTVAVSSHFYLLKELHLNRMPAHLQIGQLTSFAQRTIPSRQCAGTLRVP